MATPVAAWRSAEQRAYEYLEQKLQGIPDVTAFLPEEYPRVLAEGQSEMWSFEVNGDSPIAPTAQVRPDARPYSCWRMGAQLTGVFTTRASAQTLAGMAMAALPADTDDLIDSMQLHWASMPTVEPEIVEAGDSGYELRGWGLVFPMWVIFGNSDYAGE